MPWAEVSLSVPREQAEQAEQALEEQGALAITFEDQADNPVLEPAVGTAPLWPVVEIRGLFEQDTDRSAILTGLLTGLLKAGVIQRPDCIAWRDVADQDWERAWMDRFQPMQFGQHLWIVPSGMPGPDDPLALQLKLDPGLAFGTGTHPTTALCLEWIDGMDLRGLRVMDFGCGSGVLGIAAALKGAASICCVDNDPQALLATVDNAERNGVSERIECYLPEDWVASRHDVPYDVIVANILAGPLMQLAPQLCACLRPNAHIVLSGILDHQADEVAAAYVESCGPMQQEQREEWVRLLGHRLSDAVLLP
ncbi:MAG: 50S ribosomal protein L11 methyltransferase [Xanthomonadales bacterium]|nr:50S ribosomal protein L11 methyltransferase [Xanthomonadales bacterium]